MVSCVGIGAASAPAHAQGVFLNGCEMRPFVFPIQYERPATLDRFIDLIAKSPRLLTNAEGPCRNLAKGPFRNSWVDLACLANQSCLRPQRS
jgi:hypothetical protein